MAGRALAGRVPPSFTLAGLSLMGHSSCGMHIWSVVLCAMYVCAEVAIFGRSQRCGLPIGSPRRSRAVARSPCHGSWLLTTSQDLSSNFRLTTLVYTNYCFKLLATTTTLAKLPLSCQEPCFRSGCPLQTTQSAATSVPHRYSASRRRRTAIEASEYLHLTIAIAECGATMSRGWSTACE